MANQVHELHYRLQVKDQIALWDAASVKALSYPDVTLDTMIEMIGPREDMDVADCLLIIFQSLLSGCELITMSCSSLLKIKYNETCN